MIIYLSLGIFLTYVLTIIIKFGIPECLSDTYYQVGKWFTIVLCLSSLLMLQEMGPLGIPLIGSIVLVGCAPRYKSFELKMHKTAAIASMILAQAWILTRGEWWLISMLLLPWWLSKKSWLFWIEIICFLEIYVNEILKQI